MKRYLIALLIGFAIFGNTTVAAYASSSKDEVGAGFIEMEQLLEEIKSRKPSSSVVLNRRSAGRGAGVITGAKIFEAPAYIWELSIPVYSRRFADYEGLPLKWVDESLPQDVLAMNYVQYTDGMMVRCLLNVLFDKDIGIAIHNRLYDNDSLSYRDILALPKSRREETLHAQDIFEAKKSTAARKPEDEFARVFFINKDTEKSYNFPIIAASRNYNYWLVTKITIEVECPFWGYGVTSIPDEIWLRKSGGPEFTNENAFDRNLYYILPFENKFSRLVFEFAALPSDVE